ncbi:MAG: metal ABC transporter permease [Puniceicoccales bacterium]|jgi:manganese/iron transport system permease protein|nr:metal ABC transporter permease [Puniceicoccales bacterium]
MNELTMEIFAEDFSDFLYRALLGIALAALNCSVLGAYVVTRKMAFVSTALTHTILPGIVAAFLLGFSLYWGALGAAVLTAAGIGALAGRRELREDTAVGVMFSLMFALGVWMMAQTGSYRDFQALLFGNAIGVTDADLLMIGGVTAVIFALLVLFHNRLELTSYDEEYARQCGLSPERMRLLLLVLVALSTVSCVRLVGALLTTALLVTPAATAALLARTLRGMMALSAVFGVAGGVGGLLVSYFLGLWQIRVPSGAAVVVVCSVFFFAVFAGKFLWQRRRISPTTP